MHKVDELTLGCSPPCMSSPSSLSEHIADEFKMYDHWVRTRR